eukprot:SAG31_NODE_11011_length_1074_cov_1.219487_1_plen_118_part_10
MDKLAVGSFAEVKYLLPATNRLFDVLFHFEESGEDVSLVDFWRTFAVTKECANGGLEWNCVRGNGRGRRGAGQCRGLRCPSGQGPTFDSRGGSAPANLGSSLRPPSPEGDDGERARQR